MAVVSPSPRDATAAYDDPEGLLRDQGLEVVVLPYRPSPPPPPSRPRRAAASPAAPESKACDDDGSDDDGSAGAGADTPAPSSPSARPLMITPRTEAAITEALEHKAATTPPRDDGLTAAPSPARRARVTVVSASATAAPARGAAARDALARTGSAPTVGGSRGKSADAARKKKPRDPHQKLGLYQMAKMGYQELCNAIIRPPRSNYSLESLGPEEFCFCGEPFVRKDFGVVNERGLLVECSIWKQARVDEDDDSSEDLLDAVVDDIEVLGEDSLRGEEGPREEDGQRGAGRITLNVDDWDEDKERGHMFLHVPESFEDDSICSSCGGGSDDANEVRGAVTDESRDDAPPPEHPHLETMTSPYYQGSRSSRRRRRDPVVIYLHGNSSGRIEVVPQLGHLLSLGVAVVAFDFTGSGKSEGEFVSLGYYEREDLQTVIHHLRASGDVSSIALWGRSMGAATAIMYGSRDPTISCMILDSAFTDLTRLAEEMVERGKEQGVNVPNFVVSVALRMIKSSIKSQAGFSIRHISPISHVNRCFIPAMFVAGEHDDFIKKRHSETLHEKYAGERNLVVVDGDHNSPRPRFLLQSACMFLQGCMQLNPSAELVVPLGTNLFAPPWSCPKPFHRMGLGIETALERARAAVASATASATTPPHAAASLERQWSSNERRWLPHDNIASREPQRQRSQPFPGRGEEPPPGLPLDGVRSRSDDVRGPSRDAAPPTTEFSPPDMSERQKEIQSSLFKMLGRDE